ncbi:MAG: LON peptidase substrate-binding domain-containing protein [Gammaproteobacteria bacterium]
MLFPGGPLELRIFEPRYLDMVSACLKGDQGFGVCLIAEGSETGTARTCTVGTLARIHGWIQGDDGLLHIRAPGAGRRALSRIAHPRAARWPQCRRCRAAAGSGRHALAGFRAPAGRTVARLARPNARALCRGHAGL